jgi:hypothetical protein
MNHNIFLAVLFNAALGFAGQAPVLTGGMNEDMREIRGLVEAVHAQATRREIGEFAFIPDNYSLLQEYPETLELESRLARQWPVVLAFLDSVAGTDAEKAIVLIACGRWLTAKAYVEFLDAVLSLIEQGRLDRQFFILVEDPPNETCKAWAVLDRRASKHPQARRVVERARALFQDREDMVLRFNGMLTGESLREWKRYEADRRRQIIRHYIGMLVSPVVAAGIVVLAGVGSCLFWRHRRHRKGSRGRKA